jgi:site-specific recombinase XerD
LSSFSSVFLASSIGNLVQPEKEGEGSMGEDSLLERVTTAAEERHLSQNTLTAYRRTWLKLIAGAAAEGLALETLPSDRAGEFYKEATRGRSASHHHLQVKAALALLYDVVGYKSIRRVPGSQILARENRAALPHCLAIGTTPA